MIKKINNFAYFKDSEIGVRLTFTYSILDDNGNMIRNNIRESMGVKDSDVDILESLKKIKEYIELDINK